MHVPFVECLELKKTSLGKVVTGSKSYDTYMNFKNEMWRDVFYEGFYCGSEISSVHGLSYSYEEKTHIEKKLSEFKESIRVPLMDIRAQKINPNIDEKEGIKNGLGCYLFCPGSLTLERPCVSTFFRAPHFVQIREGTKKYTAKCTLCGIHFIFGWSWKKLKIPGYFASSKSPIVGYGVSKVEKDFMEGALIGFVQGLCDYFEENLWEKSRHSRKSQGAE